MRCLLDTHTFLWFLANAAELSADAQQVITAPETEVWVSLATAWEIAIKKSLGRLRFPEPLDVAVKRGCDASGFRLLAMDLSHVEFVARLPFHHRDPFDRMLVSQCLQEKLTLISRDAAFDAYGVPRVW